MQLQLQLPKLLGVAQTFVRAFTGRTRTETATGAGSGTGTGSRDTEISYELCLTHCPEPSIGKSIKFIATLPPHNRHSIWLQFKSPTAMQLIASEISIFQLCAANCGFNWIYTDCTRPAQVPRRSLEAAWSWLQFLCQLISQVSMKRLTQLSSLVSMLGIHCESDMQMSKWHDIHIVLRPSSMHRAFAYRGRHTMLIVGFSSVSCGEQTNCTCSCPMTNTLWIDS